MNTRTLRYRLTFAAYKTFAWTAGAAALLVIWNDGLTLTNLTVR